jgi:hypothetical protein
MTNPHCATHPAVQLVCPACLGGHGGKVVSDKKAAAARANGLKGGRPHTLRGGRPKKPT